MTFLSDFDKLLVVGLIIVVGLVLVSAGNVSTSQPYHSFSQITGVGLDSVAPSNVLLPVYGGTGVTGCLDGNVLKWNTVQSKWVCGGVDANIVNVYNALTNNYTTLQQTVTNVQQNISDINQTVVNLNQTIVNGGSLPVCSAGQTIVYNGFSWACSTGTAVAGVSKIIAGTNVTISPASGTGDVTINASGGSGGGSGTSCSSSINFITPQTIYNSASPVAYTTANVSAYVPTDANQVILQVTYGLYAGSSVNPQDPYLYIRKDSSSPSYVLARGYADYSVSVDWRTTGANQGIFPMTASHTFDYAITSVNGYGFTNGAKLDLIGYVRYNCSATSSTLGFPSSMQVYDANGSWTAPTGVTRIKVRAWGGGGGGGLQTGCAGNGSGGGGGGYAESIISVTPGTTYSVVVGSGGTGGTNVKDNATAGNMSYFNSPTTIAAYGGGRGLEDCVAGNTLPNGGTGGLGLGTLIIQGGNGGDAGSYGGLGDGGDAAMGGQGGIVSVANNTGANYASPGRIPGGGGSGGGASIGGNGAQGRVLIEVPGT